MPDEWASRALYVRDDGARNWLEVSRDPTYTLHDPDRYNLRANRLAAVAGRPTATMLSLGPGDGLIDLAIVQALAAPPAGLLYIPVEISLRLLQLTIATLHGHVARTVGVLGDFEAGGAFVGGVVAQHARQPLLLSLLGGTLGNLDHGEGAFFAWRAR